MLMNIPSQPNLIKKVGSFAINMGELLGSGRFGTVFSGYHKNHSSPLAIKQIQIKVSSSELEPLKEIIHSELEKLKVLTSHKNILQFIDKAISVNNLYLATEFCEGGSLEAMKENIKIEESVHLMKQVVDALSFAHSNNIIHGDLRPNNILNHKGDVKISDFGLATLVEKEETKQKIASKKGAANYAAPELFYNSPPDEKSDVWSLGIIFYELLYKKLPWTGKNMNELIENMKRKKIKFTKEVCDDEAINRLISQMLKMDPKERISMEQVKSNEVFQRGIKTMKNKK